MTEWGPDWDEEAAQALLARQRLGRTGLEVTLDKGFEPGGYAVTVEYGAAARRDGFTPARRQARHYAARLHGQLSHMAGHMLGPLDDAALEAGVEQKHDLECTFLTFAVTTDDGSWHDDIMKERLRTACLRTEREWDQPRAGVDERRRDHRREHFRQRLETLLAGEAYRQLDGATRERLLAEVTAMVFSPKGREL